MTDLKTSLIEEMENAKHEAPNHPSGMGFNEGVDFAIEIIRTFEAELLAAIDELPCIISSGQPSWAVSRKDAKSIISAMMGGK